MSTIINATTTNGVVIQPDNSGSLVLQTNNGTTALTVDTSQNTTFAKSIILNGSTSGTITVAAPAVSGSTTLTLQANTGNIPVVTGTGTSGQVLTSGGSGAVSTWATPASGGMTLLGTVNTTSGTSQTLSSLTLTGYKQLYITMSGVTMSTSGYLTYTSTPVRVSNNIGSTNIVYGVINQDLTTGVFTNFGAEQTTDPTYSSGIIAYLDVGQTIHAITGRTNLTTSSTSVTIGCSAGTLTAGSFTVYGVK